MTAIQPLIAKIADKQNLTKDEAGRVFQIIMNAGATPAQIAAILIALKMKKETGEELAGATEAIKLKAKRFEVAPEMQDKIIDTCGTGGDNSGSWNISTACGFVVAGCGVPVVKHGNKAVSSNSGSADVLKEMGVAVEAETEKMQNALTKGKNCFLLAPNYHPAMKHVAPIRQELKLRTIFNLIGPLVNPAFPKRQIVGVYSKDLLEVFAQVMILNEMIHCWIVCGEGGLDEISTTGETDIIEVKNGFINRFKITPEEFGIERADPAELKGGSALDNARKLKALLNGETGAYRNIVLLNSAAALVIAGRVVGIAEGLKLAAESIDNGWALKSLEILMSCSNE
jgi:anthranilate phosphoribosyltransferase